MIAQVADTRVETEFVDDVLALLDGTGDTNHPTPLDPRDLTDDCSNRTRRRGNDHGLARLWLSNIEQTHVCRLTRHPKHPDGCRERCQRRVELADAAAIGEGVLLPPVAAQHEVPDIVSVEVRLDHAGDGATGHDVADLEPSHVGRTRVHAPSHVRVEREINRPAEHLTLGGARNLGLDETEIGIFRKSLGPRRELNLSVHEVLTCDLPLGLRRSWR